MAQIATVGSIETSTAERFVDGVLAIQRLGRCIAHARGLSGEQGLALQGVLQTMQGSEGIRATEIAARLGLSASVLSRHLAELQERGLIERHTDPGDRRAQRLTLSARGRGAVQEARNRQAALVREALEGWEESEAESAVALLDKLVTTLENSFRSRTPGADKAGAHSDSAIFTTSPAGNEEGMK
ncbi:MarR family winged helix-turn-helix transcriptional regulator [Psychromicrobium xiongbiense]|uniref:MarR family winged helix-turn-helix transcriptional regulator n=1 Tax=Psychromicrobium xiongbiense TaxID=3051184 RepID=UPI002553B874|nr:MarR family winged helix-turn-helix transcriptional regulator [Psychromicrobium sp. YIM S02556]